MRGALPFAAFLVGAAVVGAQSSPDGIIVGHVTLVSRVRGTALPSNVYQPRAVGHHDGADAPEIRNVVVYLKGAVYPGVLPVAHREIRQERETFLPRVLAVTRGSTVDFPNGDPVFHNVFSLSGAKTFDLGRYPMGQTKSITVAKPGLVKVYCHIHSHMSASILVLDHPYFTIPELNGSFRLTHLPPGTYQIVGWHERVGERLATISVEPGSSTSVELSLPVQDEP